MWIHIHISGLMLKHLAARTKHVITCDASLHCQLNWTNETMSITFTGMNEMQIRGGTAFVQVTFKHLYSLSSMTVAMGDKSLQPLCESHKEQVK